MPVQAAAGELLGELLAALLLLLERVGVLETVAVSETLLDMDSEWDSLAAD